MKNEIRKKILNNDKFLNLNEILKEKLLYDNMCYKHNLSFIKYCTTCNKDICKKCLKEKHSDHNNINYENYLPNKEEMNSIIKKIRQYENDNNILMNEINNMKNEFNNILNQYKLKLNDIVEYIKNFSSEKINFNSIYKYRLISNYFSEYENTGLNKNDILIQNIEKNIKQKEKQKIKNEYHWLIKSTNKLKEFIKNIDLKNSLSNTINKILDIIDTKFDSNISNKFINKRKLINIQEITPYYLSKMKTNSTTRSNINNKTSDSTCHNLNKRLISSNDIYTKKIYNNTLDSISIKKNSVLRIISKSMTNINSLNKFGVYERKSIRQKSSDCRDKNIKINLLSNFDNNDRNSSSRNDNESKRLNKNINNNNIKIDKNYLQKSINETKIILNDINEKKSNLNYNRTKDFINKSFLTKNNFFNKIKLLNPEESANISYTNKASKNFEYLGKINKNSKNNNNNTISSIKNKYNIITPFTLKEDEENNFNKNNSNVLIEKYRPKKNNSVEATTKKRLICDIINNNDINNINILNYNQTYNKKENNNLSIKRKYITLDMSKNLSSFESNTSSFLSNTSAKKYNNIFLNDSPFTKEKNANNNKHNLNDTTIKLKLYLGLILGNTECIIGLNSDINNNTFNNNNLIYMKIPTLISFIKNLNEINKQEIIIGEEAEKFQQENSDQTILNIIKLFGKNIQEIKGKIELWPFKLYNESNKNIPMIKINGTNNNVYYYSIEDILYFYLKKVFEIFFEKLNINNTREKTYFNINISVGIPNYFNYIQRNLLKKIFMTKLFPKNKNNRYNIYSNYNIQLNNIYIENISNLISYSIFNNYSGGQNLRKNTICNTINNILILFIGGCSTNISIVKLTKENKNKFIEFKYINSAEFGDEDFLDNLIDSCLAQFKQNIKNNCLNSPLILSRIRKALIDVKNKFDKNEVNQIEININRLFGNIDLKMSMKIDNYYTVCMDYFRKIIFLIKESIINSGNDLEKINDIVLLGNISNNIKLKKMISELFKEKNEFIYNKLIKNSDEIDTKNNNINYLINGSIIQCMNKSKSCIDEYKIINISHSSIGIEEFNEEMNFFFKKGDCIPIKLNKYIKIKKPINNCIILNIYEGENKYVKNNKLISHNTIDIEQLINIKKDEKYIELLIEIFLDSNYNLRLFILDRYTYKRLLECII